MITNQWVKYYISFNISQELSILLYSSSHVGFDVDLSVVISSTYILLKLFEKFDYFMNIDIFSVIIKIGEMYLFS